MICSRYPYLGMRVRGQVVDGWHDRLEAQLIGVCGEHFSPQLHHQAMLLWRQGKRIGYLPCLVLRQAPPSQQNGGDVLFLVVNDEGYVVEEGWV